MEKPQLCITGPAPPGPMQRPGSIYTMQWMSEDGLDVFAVLGLPAIDIKPCTALIDSLLIAACKHGLAGGPVQQTGLETTGPRIPTYEQVNQAVATLHAANQVAYEALLRRWRFKSVLLWNPHATPGSRAVYQAPPGLAHPTTRKCLHADEYQYTDLFSCA